MVVSGTKLGLLTAVGVVLSTLLLGACASPSGSTATFNSVGQGPQTTASTTLTTIGTTAPTSEVVVDTTSPEWAARSREAQRVVQQLGDAVVSYFSGRQDLASVEALVSPSAQEGLTQMLSALVEPTSYKVIRVSGSDSGTVVQVWLVFVDPNAQQADYSLTMVVDPGETTITAIEPGSPPVTTTTTAPDLTSLGQLDWPTIGLQPETVMQVLHQELGTGVVPIYLPKTLPQGFHTVDFIFEQATGDHLPNPQVWNQSLGERAGYGVTFTDGVDTVTVRVNPAADTGEGEWQQTDIPFEGGFFSFQEGAPGFLQASGAKGSVVVVEGTMLDAVWWATLQLVRVE